MSLIKISEQIYQYSEFLNKLIKTNLDDFKRSLPATAKNNLIQSYKLLKECCQIIDEIMGVEEVR